MSASFFALLDDIAVLAKAAAASVDDIVAGAARASVKSAGVVIDDAAVTPQYVQGISPKRELPVIWKITKGSLLNKAIIIIAIMLLSLWAPWVFPWLLLAGGTYLSFEGAEKVWHWLRERHGKEHTVEEVVQRSATSEKQIVGSAVRTDLVLSTEIMLISLANIEATEWAMRLGILVAVALIMTLLVYGSVAVLVRMDDVGFWLRRTRVRALQLSGSWLVRAMPRVFQVLSVVGVIAMLWVGGHILVVNLAEVGVHWFADALHAVENNLHGAHAAIIWVIDSLLSAVFGLFCGAIIVTVLAFVARVRNRAGSAHAPSH